MALVAAIFSTLMSASAAFAFSRLRFKGRRPGLLSLVLLQMFPQILAITAIFILMTKISEVFPQFGSGTVTGLILIYLGGSLDQHLPDQGLLRHGPDRDRRVREDRRRQSRAHFLRPGAAPFGAGHVVVFFVTFTFVFNELAIAQTFAAEHDRHHPGGGHADLRVGQPAGVGQVRRGCAAGSHSDDYGLRLHAAVPGHGPDLRSRQGLRPGRAVRARTKIDQAFSRASMRAPHPLKQAHRSATAPTPIISR